MRRPTLSRVPTALCFWVLVCRVFSPGTAGAEELPIVRITGLDLERPASNLKVALDRQLPGGQEFLVEIPAPGSYDVSGTIEIWPEAALSCGATSRPAKLPQFYMLGLATSGENALRTLRARVPKLQVGQVFCFTIEAQRSLNATEAAYVAVRAADSITSSVIGDNKTQLSSEQLEKALSEALNALKLEGSAREAAKDAEKAGKADKEAAEAANDAAKAAKETAWAAANAAFVSYLSNKGTDLERAYYTAEAKRHASQPNDAQRTELQAARDSTLAALRDALRTALGSNEVRQALLVSLLKTKISSRAGAGQTPDTANYAAVDAGVVLAFPSGGRDHEPWLVPYLGVNLYFVPVDRGIALSELVGSPFLQRFSLTFGFTLTSPSIPGRTVGDLFLNRFPVGAVGWRTSQFARFTLGVIVYKLADANPASGGESLRVAPFGGISLDMDVIHLLTQAKF